jgi:soluble lytic murein transglycosylase
LPGETLTPSENILIPRLSCGNQTLATKFVSRLVCAAGAALLVCAFSFAGEGAKPAAAPVPTRAPAAKPVPVDQRLEKLARVLKQQNSTWAYSQLSALASQKGSGVSGMRAALVLGYFDYNRAHYAQAAPWLDRAKGDPLLADYALFWSAENDLALGHNADALRQFAQFRRQFSDSVIAEQALESLAKAALAANRPGDAVAALQSNAFTADRPPLLYLRGAAREMAGDLSGAAAEFQSLYLRFATTEQGRQARTRLGFLRGNPAAKIPPLTIDLRLAHADLLFGAKMWDDARGEYAESLTELAGAARERAQLRILECGMSLGAGSSEMAALQIGDPEVDAERFVALADFYRSQQQEPQLAAAVESAVSRAPASRWTERALFLAGNYYWTHLDRDRAVSYYHRLEESFPAAPEAGAAQWRVAWTAVLKRQADAAALVQEHLQRYPGSPFTADALYWLGRLAEEAGNLPLARSYYGKLAERYPQNYFTSRAAARLDELGSGPKEIAAVLPVIPPAPDPPPLTDAIPPAAARRYARATALRSIAFDASASLELRAAYAATGEPRLLLEAAQTSIAAGNFGAAFAMVRQLVPQLESQPFADVPREAWLAAYAMPFESSIRRWSAKAGLDPMLVAGLIRQESAFEAEARSGANAVGVMQLLPQTARLLAKSAKIRYSRAQLTNPDYNIRLGTAYLAGLQKQFGTVEAALAAYNAGEDRVVSWTAGQNYREEAEFVDSIPFTETRQYVQIVTRNADIYRRLYGVQNESAAASARHGH